MESMTSTGKTGAVLATLLAVMALGAGIVLVAQAQPPGPPATMGPTEVQETPSAVVPRVLGMSLKDAVKRLKKGKFNVKVEGFKGKGARVKRQKPPGGRRVAEGSEVTLLGIRSPTVIGPSKVRPERPKARQPKGPRGPALPGPEIVRPSPSAQWEIASASTNPRLYTLGKPLRLNVGIKDTAKSSKPAKGLNLVIRSRFTDQAGSVRWISKPPLGLDQRIGLKNKFKIAVPLKEVAKADGKDEVHVEVVLMAGRKVMDRRTIRVQPKQRLGLKAPKGVGAVTVVKEPPAGVPPEKPGSGGKPLKPYTRVAGETSKEPTSPIRHDLPGFPYGGQISVNGNADLAVLRLGDSATLQWDVSVTPGAEGIYPLVGEESDISFLFPLIGCLGGPDTDSMPLPYHAGSSGTMNLDTSSFVPGKRYAVFACPGTPGWVYSKPTNMVHMEYNTVRPVDKVHICPGLGDLTVSDIWLDGSEVRFKYVNIGKCAISAERIGYRMTVKFLGNEKTWGQGKSVEGVLPAGQGRYGKTWYYLYQPPLRVTVEINPSGGVTESDMSNNSRTETWVQLKPTAGSSDEADLIIQSGSYEHNCEFVNFWPCDGTGKIKVRNIGQSEARDFYVWLRGVGIGGSHWQDKSRAKVDRLRPGQTKEVVIQWGWDLKPYFEKGSAAVLMTAVVDPRNEVAETSETNNWQTIAELRPTKTPDLVITGGYVHIKNRFARITVKNQGEGRTIGLFKVSLSSPQFSISPSSYYSGSRSLSPGSSVEFEIQLENEGDLWKRLTCCEVTAIVDEENMVAERKENNNTRKITDIRGVGREPAPKVQ